jgi:O-antigen ligase/tetratricopeptide (TPR) repeat protein
MSLSDEPDHIARSRSRINRTAAPAFYVVLALTALAPILGGSTKLWAAASLAAATGLLFLIAPPTRSLGRVPNIAFAALIALALVAFLPARWFPFPDWRSVLEKLGARLPATVTAQPWLTFQSTLHFLLGLAWSYYLLAADWSLAARKKGWSFIALLIVGLSAAITVANFLQVRIPFWPHTQEFGFFPNRNHTSNVLGIGGILVYALALDGFARRQRHWWIWIAALSLICWALILDYSRAGIILVVAGMLTWHLFWLITSDNKRRPLIASAGILLLLVVVFAWNGGKTMMRFINEESNPLSASNMRFAIYRDAVDLSARAPLTGIGLPNFRYVFSTAQTHSIGEDVAAHPESDWLWAAVELGWLAPLLIAVLFVWWLSRCFPFEPVTFRLLRFAAMVCGCGFALHAFFDVPGHHIGAILPTLLLAGTALHPNQPFKLSRLISILFRLTGIVLLFGAVFSFLSIAGSPNFPTDVTVDRWQKQIALALDENDYESASNMASRALGIAPLEWNLYYQRAVAEVGLHSRMPATRDFAIARYLLPQWPDLWWKEGQTWALAGEIDEAFQSWARMLRHFPQQAPGLYRDIYGSIKDEPELVDRWRLLGRDNKECLLVFFQKASPVEFRVELDRLLADDPELKALDTTEKLTLFEAWYRYGDKLELAEALREKSNWRAIAWKQLARVYADYGDYQNACATARQFASIPPVPDPPAGLTTADLELRARLHPTDIDTAAALCLTLAKEDQVDQALVRLQALHGVKGFPDYLRSLEAQLWEGKAEWGKAWNALSPFVSG